MRILCQTLANYLAVAYGKDEYLQEVLDAGLHLQASGRLYYVVQTLADAEEALAAAGPDDAAAARSAASADVAAGRGLGGALAAEVRPERSSERQATPSTCRRWQR